MSLPLPKQKDYFTVEENIYSEGQLLEYGQACRDAALEDAAKFIEGGSFLHDQSPAKLFAEQLAPKIRGLK